MVSISDLSQCETGENRYLGSEDQVSSRLSLGTWRRHAACRGRLDLEWIDPTPEQADRCRAVCAACPVLAACQLFALTTGEPWGIWGGLDPDERAVIAVLQGYAAPRSLPLHGTNYRYAKHNCRCEPCRYAHRIYERGRLARHRTEF